MRIAVITIAHGRHDHWINQRIALSRQTVLPDLHILVAMQDPHIPIDHDEPPLSVRHLRAETSRLPLARARNRGAENALSWGADLLIFLDVDCLPGQELVSSYATAAMHSDYRDSLLCGPVTYLASSVKGANVFDNMDELDDPHPARPAPERGSTLSGGNPEQFWSLSFALTANTWRTIGGFNEEFTGYGGEDTDFGLLANRAGIDLAWVGGARAYHQFHPIEDPPVRHLHDILRNGRIFAKRWGYWPMSGWLDQFEELGLVKRDSQLNYRLCDSDPIATPPLAS